MVHPKIVTKFMSNDRGERGKVVTGELERGGGGERERDMWLVT